MASQKKNGTLRNGKLLKSEYSILFYIIWLALIVILTPILDHYLFDLSMDYIRWNHGNRTPLLDKIMHYSSYQAEGDFYLFLLILSWAVGR